MSRKFIVKYVTAPGVEYDLSVWPYYWNNTNLHNYAWEYDFARNNIGNGSAIKDIKRNGRAYAVELLVLNTDQSVITTALNALHAAFDADVFAGTPGRLYVDSQYITGYFIESTKSEYTQDKKYIKLSLAFITGSPFWITERLISFPIFAAAADTGFILPTVIPMQIGAVLSSARIINTHYAASGSIITMYGPATDPSFSLGTHIYTVSGALIAGERYEIDQAKRTVVKITSSGERINAFNLRGKAYSVFEPIPAGESVLYYNGDFAIDITLLKERSEPLWS